MKRPGRGLKKAILQKHEFATETRSRGDLFFLCVSETLWQKGWNLTAVERAAI